MLQIGLTYDMRQDYLALGYSEAETAEFDSNLTILAIEQAIQVYGARAERIGHAKNLAARLAAGERWDLVFNIAEGLYGRSREAQVPAMLELYGIHYTFSDPLVCALTLDKALTKLVVRASGFNTPDFSVVNNPDDLSTSLPFPLFAKPLAEGTGKGVSARSLIATRAELEKVCLELLADYRQPVLVEEYLPGREFTVGILGNGPGAHVLGTMEVTMRQPTAQAIYSYETKENWHKRVAYSTPPADALSAAVESLALGCYRALQCRDAARVDIRLDAYGEPSFMEINPLPGLNPIHSDLPIISYQAGCTYNDLIHAVLTLALDRASAQDSR